jgi:hypothetical protein
MYLDEEGAVQTKCSLEKIITPDVIRQYRNLLHGLKDKDSRLNDCIITVRSESVRIDSSLPNITATGLTMLAAIIAIDTAIFSSSHYNDLLLAFAAFIVFMAYPLLIWANRFDSRKRQHYSVMLQILDEMKAQKNVSCKMAKSSKTLIELDNK